MPEDNLELSLSLHHVDPRDCTQVIRLNSKCFYTLNHLAALVYYGFCLFVCDIDDIGMLPGLAPKPLESSHPLVLTFQIAGIKGIVL